jgi:hypothetical protein
MNIRSAAEKREIIKRINSNTNFVNTVFELIITGFIVARFSAAPFIIFKH